MRQHPALAGTASLGPGNRAFCNQLPPVVDMHTAEKCLPLRADWSIACGPTTQHINDNRHLNLAQINLQGRIQVRRHNA